MSLDGGCTLSNGLKAYDINGTIVSEDVGEYSPSGGFYYNYNGNTYYSQNYKQGAVEYCQSLGMVLPTAETLQKLINKKNEYSVLPQGNTYRTTGGTYSFETGSYTGDGDGCALSNGCHVLCVSSN